MPASAESRLRSVACSACAWRGSAEYVADCPECASPVLCEYDLKDLRPDEIAAGPRDEGVFRWSALLPVRDPARRLSQGEGSTPVIGLPTLARDLGLAELWVKDEAHQPTSSFKARGLAVAVAAHVERGARAITLPSAGNAASAAASYARRHDIGCRVVIPAAASPAFRFEAHLAGARVIAVSGDIGVAAEWIKTHPLEPGDHLLATFREPYRVEGKKTMGFELWERFGDSMPDVVAYPTGGGVGLVAIHRALMQLADAGLFAGRMPRLLAAQAEGCAPVVRALAGRADVVEPWGATRRTLAEGLRVPRLAGGRLVLAALRATEGSARSVSEGDLILAIRRAARSDGVLLGAEGGVALAALIAARGAGELEGARALLFNTGSIHKSPETLQAAGVG